MKKFIKVTSLIFIVVVLGAGIYWLLRKDIRYQSIYLVPSDAAMILKMEKPFHTIDVLTQSDIWGFLKQQDDIAKLNKQVLSIDSLIHENNMLLRILGSSDLLMSYHQVASSQYDMLFITTLKQSNNASLLLKRVNKVLGDDFNMSQRTYKEHELYELLDKKNGAYYYLTFVRNKLLFSFNPKLLERAIDEQDIMTIGRDLHYIDVAKAIDQKGLLSLYIPMDEFSHWLEPTFRKDDFVGQLGDLVHYAGTNLYLHEKNELGIRLRASLNDTTRSLYKHLLHSGNSKNTSTSVIPIRCAAFVNVGMDNFQDYYAETQQYLSPSNQEQILEYQELLDKKFDISIEEHLLSWIGQEITFMQTAPANLGTHNEFALILKATNAEDARKNLSYMIDQIKKNSPVEFRTHDHKEYTIHYLSFGRLIKLLFGDLIKKLEKPYFTQIEDFVIFSNHPQTLKNIIDDYLSQSTLAYDPEYYNFAKKFKNQTSILLYVNTPVFYSNLQHIISPQSWQKMQRQEKYITSFSNIGMAFQTKRGMLEIDIASQFSPRIPKYDPVYYQSVSPGVKKPDTQDTSGRINDHTKEKYDLSFLKNIVIHDLDANKQEVLYDNGRVKYEFRIKNGRKHGIFKAYHKNGNMKIRGRLKENVPVRTWKFYDEDGNVVHEETFD